MNTISKMYHNQTNNYYFLYCFVGGCQQDRVSVYLGRDVGKAEERYASYVADPDSVPVPLSMRKRIARDDRWRKMRERGMTNSEIAEHDNVTAKVVRRGIGADVTAWTIENRGDESMPEPETVIAYGNFRLSLEDFQRYWEVRNERICEGMQTAPINLERARTVWENCKYTVPTLITNGVDCGEYRPEKVA